MNSQKVKQIIELYKKEFKNIHKEEIYKWRAVKCFQDNWNIQAKDLSKMLEKSFAQTGNLLDSGHYFPKGVIINLSKIAPEAVRRSFIDLFDEESDLTDRLNEFQKNIRKLKKAKTSWGNDFQDLRALLVYLSLKYPDRYYFYKFRLFKDFAKQICYPIMPTMGKIENALQYKLLCDQLKAEIVKDNQLLKMHKDRITDKEYFDSSFNILTQDIIWAATHKFDMSKSDEKLVPAYKRLVKVNKVLSPRREVVILHGSSTNYIENEKERKNIGDCGELLAFEYEIERLKKIGISKKPEYTAKSKGDGLGYDIQSYNGKGEKIYIEVKTTRSGFKAPFFVTSNELECSKKEKEKYVLYRIFDFNKEKNTAKFSEIKGSLENLCINPMLFRILL